MRKCNKATLVVKLEFMNQMQLVTTVIGIIDLGGVNSAFGCYLVGTRKVEKPG